MRAKGLDMSWPATVVAHLDEVCGLTWKMFVLIHQLGVDFSVTWGVKAGVETVLCVVDFALHEIILVTILFLSKDDLGKGLVDLSLRGVTPFVGANVEGRLCDGVTRGLRVSL